MAREAAFIRVLVAFNVSRKQLVTSPRLISKNARAQSVIIPSPLEVELKLRVDFRGLGIMPDNIPAESAHMVTENSQNRGPTREVLKQHVMWVSAIFPLIYVGIEVALGRWIVTYMIRVHSGDPFATG